MKTLKEMHADGEAVLKTQDELGEKMADTKTKEERDALQTQYDAKSIELDNIERDIEAMEGRQAKRAKFAELMRGVEPDADGKSLEPEADGKATSALDVQGTETDGHAHQRLFYDYMGGKSINAFSGLERGRLHPTNPAFKEGKDGVRLPEALTRVIFGKRLGDAMEAFDAKAMQSDDTTDAYLVNPDYLATLLQLTPEPGHLLGRVTVIPVKGGSVKIPRLQQTDGNEYGGMSFTWADEGDSKTETEPTFEQVEIACHEVNGYTEISHTMLRRNAISSSNILMKLYQDGMKGALDTAIISGSGTGRPQGITNATGIREVNRETVNTVTGLDIRNMKHAVLPHNRANAAFIIHDDAELALENADAAATQYHQVINNGKLNNYPYEVTVRQPSLGSDGDVLFGDPTAYYLAMEQDIVIRRSEHFKFRNNLEAFSVYAVVGGQLVEPRAMALLTASTS